MRADSRPPVAVPGSWADHAACHKQTALMAMPLQNTPGSYPRAENERLDAAVALCRTCPVLDECRAWALTFPDPAHSMIAGGYTPEQRRQVRRGEQVRSWRRRAAS